MITEPTVTLWACTTLHVPDHDNVTEVEGILGTLPPPDGVDELFSSDYLAEAAGRACYQSWDRPNPKTATTEGYLEHIRDVKHWSVMSHGSATFYIEGVSRSLTHELVRHRFLAFSQLSQRYVDSKDMDWVCPPLALEDHAVQQIMGHSFEQAVFAYDDAAVRLEQEAARQGFTGTLAKKRAREAARAVLPNETETKIVVTGNMRAWRDFLDQRWTVGADLEIQRLAGVLVRELKLISPGTFADYDEENPAS